MKNPNRSILHALAPITLGLVISTTSLMALGKNLVEITMPQEARESLKQDHKVEIKEGVELRYLREGKEFLKETIEIESRGQTSLKMPRKNFAVKSTEGGTLPKLILSAGSMDPLHVKNRIAYDLYRLAQVPALDSHLSELTINGEHQGLYMVTQDPAGFALETLGPKYEIVLRRRYDDKIEVKKAMKDLSPEKIQQYSAKLREIHKNPQRLKGSDLLSFLGKHLDLQSYFRMLGINFLIQNGDSADEVFFAGQINDNGDIQFKAIPWDMDDSFSEKMHLQSVPLTFNFGRADLANQQLMYGYESRLDRAISENAILLDAYFAELQNLTAVITEAEVSRITARVDRKLGPYLNFPGVLAAGALDVNKKAYEQASVKADIEIKRATLVARLQHMKQELDSVSRNPTDRSHKTNFMKKVIGQLIQKFMFNYTENMGKPPVQNSLEAP
jgi:hypothetical protein